MEAQASNGQHEANDAQLVLAAQGAPTAFATLYIRYRHRIYAYLRGRVGDEDEAADLTQQVFLQALAALPRYRNGVIPFDGWLFRIARNAATDRLRKQHGIPLDWLPEALHPLFEDGPEVVVLHQEALERIRLLVTALDQQSRELVLLRFAAELRVPEIAIVLGLSEAAIYKRLARVLRKLKGHYHAITL